jgi:hypothetical protein
MDVRFFIKRQSFSGLIGCGVLWNLKAYCLSEETLHWAPCNAALKITTTYLLNIRINP